MVRKFTTHFVVKTMLKEKEEKKTDCFIIIYGLPRSGKTMLELKFTQSYGIIQKYGYNQTLKDINVRDALPLSWWKDIFRNNFGISAGDVKEKIKHLPPGTIINIDEGIDTLNWHEQNTNEQFELLQLFQKTGKLGNVTVLVTPSHKLLTKVIMARARYMFILPHEHDGKGNTAYVYKNYSDPIRAENDPFNLNYLFQKVDKLKYLPTEQIYTQSKRFQGTFYFKWVHPKIYALYEKMVKDPQLLQTGRIKTKSVPYKTHMKYKYLVMTILNNLRNRDNKTYSQIREITTSKFGETLLSDQKVRDIITKYDALEESPVEIKEI